MRAGRKDRRIEIQQLTTSRNGYGEEVQSWSLYKTVWAEVMPYQGDEKFGGEQLTSEAFTKFRIDYLPGISTKTHRLKYEERIYDIQYPQEIGRREALLILAKVQGI